MGVFEYEVGLATASTSKEIEIAKTAYLGGQKSIKQRLSDIIQNSSDYEQLILDLKELTDSNDNIH